MRMTTIIFDYVCSVCWSQLIEDIDQHTAICARYGLLHAGYHRRSGVEWQRSHSDQDRQEVIRIYQDIKPFCYQLGLAKRPSIVTTAQLAANKRTLGRDDSGL
jgi:hypothetical protein